MRQMTCTRGRDSHLPLPQTRSPPTPLFPGGNASQCSLVTVLGGLWGRGTGRTCSHQWVLSPVPCKEGHGQGQRDFSTSEFLWTCLTLRRLRTDGLQGLLAGTHAEAGGEGTVEKRPRRRGVIPTQGPKGWSLLGTCCSALPSPLALTGALQSQAVTPFLAGGSGGEGTPAVPPKPPLWVTVSCVLCV